MKHKVIIYDIEHDKETTRQFETEIGAQSYASALKMFWLNRPNPAPVHIEVCPL